MLVVHSCTSNSFSGLERYVADLAQWQHENGVRTYLLCREFSELHQHALKNKIPTLTISKEVKKGPFAWIELKSVWKKILSEEKEIVLHFHAGGEPLFHLPWILNRAFSLKKVILQYHLWINHSKKNLWHKFIFSLIDEVWCSSEAAQKHLFQLLPVDELKIKVLPYGRDTEKLEVIKKHWHENREKIRSQFQIPQEAVVGLSISRIETIKGIRELFHAFVETAKKENNFYFILIGNASPQNKEAESLENEIREKLKALPSEIAKRWIAPGFLSSTELFYCAADFYVLPTYEECMSLALLDAVLMDLPLIGTNSGGTPWVVRENETGVLVRPADKQDLEQAFNRMLKTKNSFRSSGSKLREYFWNELPLKKVFLKILKMYQ
jgi:glycosyltransferase involved in cell wall biosynthesis